MPLTDVACRNAKPGEDGKPRKLGERLHWPFGRITSSQRRSQ